MEIVLPSKPKVVLESADKGVYEIDGLYPGYGHTLGNSLRRILLSSLPGAALTTVKIEGVDHEFSTLPGVKEDVINILLNLKTIRLKMHTDEPQTVKLSIKGQKNVTAKDLEVPTQVEVITKDAPIATLTSKDAKLNIEMTVERGIGYVPREVSMKDKLEVGAIVLDAIFTPVKRVSYDVENMRVGGRTDFNRLRISLQTDGSLTPRDAFETAVEIMIKQLQAVSSVVKAEPEEGDEEEEGAAEKQIVPEKVKIDDLNISSRTIGVLKEAGIKTAGGLAKKKSKDLLEIEGLGAKALGEIKEALEGLGLSLKD